MSTPGPLSAVLNSLAGGATSLGAVAEETGLSRDTVDLAVERLIAMGRLDATTLGSGCPTDGCGGCASGTSDGQAGCGATGPSVTRVGPVPIALSVRRTP
ncbi:hypothetical protein AADG42_06365 [Ammonicoccus fulvus]|uniref:Transcriptional regulator HTH-type FeoC domain-containing protein n=1 Tax=Ammonicoccus fulvus TaxID=3138240 RepID=A0ABZ3FLM2_9ACTN